VSEQILNGTSAQIGYKPYSAIHIGICWKIRIKFKAKSGAFLAAAVWGGQWGGHIFIWGAKNFG